MKAKIAQCELDLRARTHGGFRPGAGRKKKPGNHDPRHRVRPQHRSYEPVHVVMRVRKDVPRLRKRTVYRAIRGVLARHLGQLGFRVCHLSIQGTHVHYLVEASSKEMLSAGMQRLNNLTARAINRALGRKGSLFAYRYHATPIKNPRQARNTLAYVLNNWRRHNEDESSERMRYVALDTYATGYAFAGWSSAVPRPPESHQTLPVDPPRTWLLAVGWRKQGAIDAWMTPGPLPTR
jgi:REP element-mobilizing transposase RayT